ncbi:hypothetical protein F7734_23770 [Scytonema sp. UIC 10036]|uniref:hypothetical protein n=1 Tax=Scytonema sp. UIC 10036 TaxID=2304196 RepID=UPI0012DA9539|nr:hypothetical protein [Scytonema sp. UIC 10036]MUG95212.1 hypothetical protein [Scytonema sp. UIC 10036]
MGSIIDATGHYARPDVLQLLIRDDAGWRRAGSRAKLTLEMRDALLRSAEHHDVDAERVLQVASGQNVET